MEFREGGINAFRSLGEEVMIKVNQIHHQQPHQKLIISYAKKKIVKLTGLFAALIVACVLLFQSTNSFRSFSPSSFSFFSPSITETATAGGNQAPVSSAAQPSIIPSQPTTLSNGSIDTQIPHQKSSAALYSVGDGNSSSHHQAPPNSAIGATMQPSSSDNHTQELKELEKVLEKAAMVDKTVIVTTLNEAWAAPNSVFELFLESFKIGNQTQNLLNHLVVVALDQHAYDLCLNLHSNCYLLRNVGSNFSSEAYFMSSEYLNMMWKRIDFLHQVLTMGYSFVFTDVDIMWFRDPFSHFYQEADFQIACDYYWGYPSDLNNFPNGGFNYVKSNEKTIKFYEFWYKSKDVYPGKHDQDVLNSIKHDPYIKKIGLDIKFFDTAYFGGFCQPSQNLNIVVTMHANCCVGLDNKIYDLKAMLEDWRKYVAISQNSTEHACSWTVPQRCGWF